MTENNNTIKKRELFDFAKMIGNAALVVSFCGLMHQFLLLNQFNISLSDYADLDDFLVAAINFLTASGAFLVIIFFMLISLMVDTKVILNRKHSFVIVGVLAIAASSIFSISQAENIRIGLGCEVKIKIAHPFEGFKSVSTESKLFVITGLNSTFFVMEKSLEDISENEETMDMPINTRTFNNNYIAVHAIPYSNIAQITTICGE